MSDSVLGAFTQRLMHHEDHLGDDVDDSENCGAFGWLRGPKERAIFLEFRLKDGNVFAIGNTWLEKVSYNASEGITLKFTNHTIRILGRNFAVQMRPGLSLLNGILRHKVPWVSQADSAAAMVADKQAVVIERIELVD
jgi:hypothetical protein